MEVKTCVMSMQEETPLEWDYLPLHYFLLHKKSQVTRSGLLPRKRSLESKDKKECGCTGQDDQRESREMKRSCFLIGDRE